MIVYGLGALQSPPDERDFQLEKSYSVEEAVATPPPTFRVAKVAPLYDQGSTPQCVAYSNAGEQQAFDLIDQGHTYKWSFSEFFRLIGGGPNGAVLRNGLARRLHFGYPLLPAGSGNSAASHKISAYYAVAKNQLAIERALWQRGVLIVGLPWYQSWFTPHADGTLPPADYQVGGHAIDAVGYDARGVWLRNSWGAQWGVKGECLISWHALLNAAWEVWRAQDVIDAP